MSKLQTPGRPGTVDVVYGGQFGDEGKGAVMAALGGLYNFGVRVGGQNAEHRFEWSGTVYTGRILPCSAVHSHQTLYLGAGHIIDPDELVLECLAYAGNSIDYAHRIAARVVIDENTGVVTDEHRQESKSRKKAGGSTWRGVGTAAAHKVRRDGTFTTVGMLAERERLNVEHHGRFFSFRVGRVASEIAVELDTGRRGCAEGSQGALLSVDHGYYPYCTAKNVTPAGLFAEAGVPLSRAGVCIGVYRLLPMRVPGASGPTGGREVHWHELEDRLGKELPASRKVQTDSPTGEEERIFEWSWDDFRWSYDLTRPDYVVLTFADYEHPENTGVREWSKLHSKTRRMVMSVAEAAPVLMVRTGPGQNDFVLGPFGSQGPMQESLLGRDLWGLSKRG